MGAGAHPFEDLKAGATGEIEIEDYEVRASNGGGIHLSDIKDGLFTVGENDEVAIHAMFFERFTNQSDISNVVFDEENRDVLRRQVRLTVRFKSGA